MIILPSIRIEKCKGKILNKPHNLTVVFEDNRALPMVFGEHGKNLDRLESMLKISITHRGNEVFLAGQRSKVENGRDALEFLYEKVSSGQGIEMADVDASVRLTADKGVTKDNNVASIITAKKTVYARTPTQASYIQDMQKYPLCFGVGPAGTGKTYLAVCQAVSMLTAGLVEKIIITRPVVEAGENLGFLPGDLKEKVDPYLRPIYDALYECLPGEVVNRKLENNEIEIAPLAYMRGRTLKNAFVLLDEAQNTTTVQMKMFLTRLGDNSRMVITGDVTQVDLPRGQVSGLDDAFKTLKGVEDISTTEFKARDVVRHPLVASIIQAYEKADKKRKANINNTTSTKK